MHIEELIIEGFKSYAKRTVISQWDREFNAITGLNGSGKSNILDAICFVLGIENLRHVRATNLQDLIYKRGQAGITKASVTIIFNNEDKTHSPIGFADSARITVTRQIVLGGKNKYMVNGHVAQQKTVENLFQSVQLNVNNPHFLIMQGQITKVLNMKPPEILAMIEETAGTRMFEDRKAKALTTMAKKEKKVEEITSVLNEVITPKLDKLREERSAYLEFQKTETEVDRLRRVVVAYDYYQAESKVMRATKEIEKLEGLIKESEENIKLFNGEIKQVEKECKMIEEKKSKECRKGGMYAEMEEQFNVANNELVRLKTVLELKKEAIGEEQGRILQMKKQLEKVERNLIEKEEELKGFNFETIEREYERKLEQVKKDEELLHGLTTGISSKEGNESGFNEQIKNVKNERGDYLTCIEQNKIKVEHLNKEREEIEPKAKKAEKEIQGMINELEKNEREIREMKAKIENNKMKIEQEGMLKERERIKMNKLNELERLIEEKKREFRQFEFEYSDPYPNFDKSQVKGIVANLIKLSEDNLKYSVALEVAAGGRMFNVVVDNEKVATSLLEKGKLQKRSTMIPLNKIVSFKLNKQQIDLALNSTNGKSHLAIDLVNFDDKVKAAIEFVFGSIFICDDKESANKITFNKQIRVKSVTIDGDIYDPAGTLTGGSKSTNSNFLIRLRKFHDLKIEFESEKSELEKIRKDLNLIKDLKELIKQLELKEYEFNLFKEQFNSNSSTRIVERFKEIIKEIEEIKKSEIELQRKEKDCLNEIKRIENEMKKFEKNKDKGLIDLKNKIIKEKNEINNKFQEMNNFRLNFETLQQDINQLKLEIEEIIKLINLSNNSIQNLRKEENDLEISILSKKENSEILFRNLEIEKSKFLKFDKELTKFENIKKEKLKSIQEEELTLQQLNHSFDSFKNELASSNIHLNQLLSNNDWIKDQKQNFNKPNSLFDFNNMNENKKKLSQLESLFSKQRKNINVKVMDMIDTVEKKEKGLKEMLSTVKKDKKNIEQTIIKLDEYKKDALQKTWIKVNNDFGAIFGDLLPGNTARLDPPEGQDIIDGLCVKVNLGGVWKQSLTELSGGQRSLVALSLILALLQYKPAPMYILDEVDAALDLSHTQNIGQLFKNRFKGSQFIVVSLKEGMFNNANVLFRTKFRDGLSAIERHARSMVPKRKSIAKSLPHSPIAVK
ncbi:RecF/RecN/SMC protein [Rozella allomycis CSF55]|uniref:Structural maintenance of chromosomes protein n=1 Tax=Rozella allomycis (strain CSF55) TaxID=988480 RepID=A0A075AXU0_ROZAC|nr:Structural maintenance of chromosomes Smc2 domain-containing protein [Rozella allomycis CSF55]RKP20069.1 RecF/RecN/SMC protein [Rozella allomycis CSF55]|eukprot:EPZ34969.1 Structural maintenance of chromosomes Smc2 domain-containing protein [Rozella allomycis CSF55]